MGNALHKASTVFCTYLQFCVISVMFLSNVHVLIQDYTASHLVRRWSSYCISATKTNLLIHFRGIIGIVRIAGSRNNRYVLSESQEVGIIDMYCQNRRKYVRTLCGHNAEFLTVKSGGTCSYQYALKG
jgi:hypothetical protein